MDGWLMPLARNRSRAIGRRPSAQAASLPSDQTVGELLADVRTLIDSARGHVAQVVNAGLVRLYWSVGQRIRQDILSEKRAEYGQQIIATLSRQLTRDYGQGFTRYA